MALTEGIKNYFAVISAETKWKRPQNLKSNIHYLFGDLSFEGKRLLDIGGGDGVFTLYAAVSGAKEAVCLEPEAHGSTAGVRDKFERMAKALGVQSAKLLSQTVQEYNPQSVKFDIVFMHNSVNHLDEETCMRLQHDPKARAQYISIFSRINDLMLPGGTLIMADCSCYNVFQLLGIRNPLVPSIDWRKHQSPKFWSFLAEPAGFERTSIRWKSFSRLGWAGRLLLGNKLIAYLTYSHFCLTMRKTVA